MNTTATPSASSSYATKDEHTDLLAKLAEYGLARDPIRQLGYYYQLRSEGLSHEASIDQVCDATA